MDVTVFATKGNLIAAKNTLKLSRQGYELLDKKRTILINEMMSLIEVAEEIQSKIDVTFREAYEALQNVNIAESIRHVKAISHAVPITDNINIRFRSVMGVELPEVTVTGGNLENKEHPKLNPTYGFFGTTTALDNAYDRFEDVKRLTIRLAEIENAVYRLAMNIKKTQRRANALKNIIIPRYEGIVSNIQNVLEEKDREEFTRLKVIKRQKM